jgi:signal transduction histidine kinase
MRIGTTLITVAVSSSLVALSLYGSWSISIRRSQLMTELGYEEANLATILKSALEMALEHREIGEAVDVVEKLSAADRIYGIAVHARPRGAVAMSASLKMLPGHSGRDTVDAAIAAGREQQMRLTVGGSNYLVHVLPLQKDDGTLLGMAEVWRDLGYIDQYLRDTVLRLLLFALVLGGLLSGTIVFLTHRSITRPAAALIRAMDEVANGNLAIRVATPETPRGELGNIARSFDRLAGRLEQARQELEAGARERNELAARLRHTERLATLGQIVAEVAHEIGTPLNVITGRAGTLRKALPPESELQGFLNVISEQAARIARIMQRLLGFARERMPAMEAVPLRRLAQSTIAFVEPDLKAAGLTVDLEIPEALAVRAESDLLQQVLLNLLLNAIQACPPGALVQVRASASDDQVDIDVIDNGPGVSAEILPRLFEPFATTKPAGQGTGLGLSIARASLRQMGGSLRFVDPIPPVVGAHFRATLPSAAAKIAEARPVPTQDPVVPGPKRLA